MASLNTAVQRSVQYTHLQMKVTQVFTFHFDTMELLSSDCVQQLGHSYQAMMKTDLPHYI